MGILVELYEAAMALAGIFGVVALLLAITFGVVFWVISSILGVGIPIEVFTHDKNFKLLPWRVVLVIGAVVGRFLIRWYLPFTIAAAIGLIGMFIEITGI